MRGALVRFALAGSSAGFAATSSLLAVFLVVFLAGAFDLAGAFWTVLFSAGLAFSVAFTASASFGGVRPGELLAGKYLDASDSHIESFLSQTREVCNQGKYQQFIV